MVYKEDFCFGTTETRRLEMNTQISAAAPAAASTGTGGEASPSGFREMNTQISAAAPAAASTGTGGAASPSGFRTWEKHRLTKIPELTKKEREKLPSSLPKDPTDGDICRSEQGHPGWVLSWTYKPSKRGAPRSTCQKAPFWCYKPVLYKKLVEEFESASAAAGTAASGTAGAGGTAASGTGAAASPTGSSAGAGECSNGGSLDLETFSEGSLPPADGAVGSTAASAASAAASAASAAMDATTLYTQLQQENKLPRRRDATEHGPKKRHPGKYYFIKGMPDDGFQLVIESKNIKRLCPRGWTRPPNIYEWNP